MINVENKIVKPKDKRFKCFPINKNFCFLFSILVFVLSTLFMLFNNIPWYDEVQAWNIVKNTNSLEQFFLIQKTEGHPFLWYLVLFPFAKQIGYYPYSIQLLNWGFCLAALILMWKRAPFHTAIKILITFSGPFFLLYSIYARSYSLNILLLFLLTIFYKNRLKKPVLFSTLLVLSANCSLMGVPGTLAFGSIFVYDLIKSFIQKQTDIKPFVLSASILFFGAAFLFFQLYPPVNSYLFLPYNFVKHFISQEFSYSTFSPILGISEIIVVFLIFLSIPLFIRKYRKILFFFLIWASFLIVFFSFVYIGGIWHHSFFLIYTIITYWLWCDKEYLDDKINHKYFTILVALLLIHSFFNPMYKIKNYYTNIYYDYVETILSNERYKNAKLYITDWYGTEILPQLQNSGLELFYIESGLLASRGIHESKSLTIEHLSNKKENILLVNKYYLANLKLIDEIQNEVSLEMLECIEPNKCLFLITPKE